MKLLEELKRHVEELGPLKRVWLTSFNLSIEFIETYLLPALLGEAKMPTERRDFEALQQQLIDQGIDIRVFADRRMINRGDRKRTTLLVHPLTPRQIGAFSERSLFHPKAIYLESKSGKAILGAGSANLTIGGWGRNQEAVVFRRVKTRKQSEQIKSFFGPLFRACGGNQPLRLGRTYWGNDESWEFVHSFDRTPFLDRLFQDRSSLSDMAVFSPYFSTDLPQLLTLIQNRYGFPKLSVRVVPDLLDGATIRTAWSDELKEKLDQDLISFHVNSVRRDPRSELSHAKVWVTSTRVAIGSWNFTQPGSNLLEPGEDKRSDNNIEAGILMHHRADIGSVVGRPLTTAASRFATREQLEDIDLVVPDELPFDIAVTFDWAKQQYSMDVAWIGSPVQGYSVTLPDTKPVAVSVMDTSQAVIDVSAPVHLLQNHYFVVLHKGQEVYQGIITETALDQRRGECFESLDELLESRISSINDKRIEFTPMLRGIAIEPEDEEPLAVPLAFGKSSYFKLFQAMEAFVADISNVANVGSLERIVFVEPGCLAELQEKVKERGIAQVDGAGNTAVYYWFLVQECMLLIALARKRYKILTCTSPNSVRWNNLALPTIAIPRGADPRYIRMIKGSCEYA